MTDLQSLTEAVPALDVQTKARSFAPDDLCDLYLTEVYAYVSRRLPDRQDAEDATAETFHAALASLHRLKGADLKLWLFGIARRKVIDSHRRHRRRKETRLSPETPSSQTVDGVVERTHRIAAIRRIVQALPEDQREVLLLQQLEGLAIAQIATVMGRSVAAVNSLLQRARDRAFKEGKAYFQEEDL